MSAACARIEPAEPVIPAAGPDEFTVSLGDPEARVYLSDGKLRWNSYGGDTLSVFTPGTHAAYESAFLSPQYPGYSTSVIFRKIDGSEQATGVSAQTANYAVYPYDKNNSIDAQGVLHTEFQGGIKLAAVTHDIDDHVLFMKSVVSYLTIPFYGDGKIAGIRFYGNNGEVLSGQAEIVARYGEGPVMTMLAGGKTERYVDYSDDPIDLTNYPNAEKATGITLTLPPTTFSQGFTVELIDVTGQAKRISTQERRVLERNVVNKMDPILVECARYKAFSSINEPKAIFDEILADMGRPYSVFQSSQRADDFGFIAASLSEDLEGADAFMANTGYNWFSTCLEYSAHFNPNYANPYLRFFHKWNMILKLNDLLGGLSGMNQSAAEVKNLTAQARTLRAYCYLGLAQQHSFASYRNDLCLPIITEQISYPTKQAHASVSDVYTFIRTELEAAATALEGASRSSKAYIDAQVANGILARTYLLLGQWEQAVSAAQKAAQGYTPASIAEVSVPSFMDISEHNWIWGIDMTADLVANAGANSYYATSSSWIRSFSGDSYSAGVGCYMRINNLLYDQIPSTDVRKGWWVDENLTSPLLANVTWGEASGNDVATLVLEEKLAFDPYTNVKFGMYKVGQAENDEDFPLMRVEEMILIQAEAYAALGQGAQAESILTSFVQAYRDPSYSIAAGANLLNEVWKQRRIELWGEGFARTDIIRFGQPLVRVISGKASALPAAYQFNIAANSRQLLLAFPSAFLNAYPNVTQMENGTKPNAGDGAGLTDGVTNL